MQAERATLKAHDVRAALRGKPPITAETPYEEFKVACPTLSAFDKGEITLGRFASPTPWENHPAGDEFLYVIDGKLEVVLLTGDQPVRIPVKAGSIFVVPRAVWHRQVPRPVASVLSALPTTHGPISWSEDPRRKRRKSKSRSKTGRPLSRSRARMPR